MVYAVACPLSHGFCALGELGKVRPHVQPRFSISVRAYQIVVQSIAVIRHASAQLPCTDSLKNLGMVCYRHINLNTAADAALRPFAAGTFRIKQFICPPASSVNSVSKQIVLSTFSQGVDIQSSQV